MLSAFFADAWSQYEPWAWFTLWVGGAVLAAAALSLIWRHVLVPLAARTRTELDGAILQALRRPLVLAVLVGIIRFGAGSSLGRVPEITAHPAWGIADGLLYVLVVLAMTWMAGAAATTVIDSLSALAPVGRPGATARQLSGLFRRLAKLVFFFLALTIILSHFRIEITGLLATAGVASLAVALAVQETLSNSFAGLMLHRP